jgi:serine/threonine protein kinase
MVEKSDLIFENGEKPFAIGGQGKLFKVTTKRRLSQQIGAGQRLLFKAPLRRAQTSNLEAQLKRLDQLYESLARADGYLLSRVATPLAAVASSKSEFEGFLMKEFNEGCYFEKTFSFGEAQLVLNELKNHLISLKERNAMSVPDLDEVTRFRLVSDLFKTLSFIHEAGLIVGDLSSSNLVVQVKQGRRNENRLIFLDVDSFIPSTQTSDGANPSTLNWRSPEELEGANLASRKTDVYKAALASIRLLHQANVLHDDTSDLYFSEEANLVLEHFGGNILVRRFTDALSTDPSERPTSQEVSYLLSEALTNQPAELSDA